MAIKIRLRSGSYITPVNAHELAQIETDILSRCVMCREILDEDLNSVEHIFPKWLQNKFDLWNTRLNLPNGSSIPYRQLTVPCCKECNSGVMSEWEKRVQTAVEGGYDDFIKLDEEIIAWWIYKLYYTKLVKELSLKRDIRDPDSEMMVTEEILKEYTPIYYYMCELLKGIKFNERKPYELYIFRTSPDNSFDYIDDVGRHVVYLKINDILIVCALDSFGIFSLQYKKEIEILNKCDSVIPIQAIELFTKIVYFKSHYQFKTSHSIVMTGAGPVINSDIDDIKQIRAFELKELYEMLINIFKIRGYKGALPEYKEHTMISTICKKE